MDKEQTVEKGHGRIEERQIRLSSELAGYSSWPYLAQVCEYTRTWTSKGVRKQQVRYGITSLSADVSDAAQLAAHTRGHWQVENGLHHVEDVTLTPRSVCSVERDIGTLRPQLRRYSGCPHEALALLGIHVDQNA